MLIEFLLTFVALAVLLWAVYSTTATAIRVLTLDSEADVESIRMSARHRQRLKNMVHDPHDVMLTADLFKSLAFLVMAALIVWVVPRWAGSLGWPRIPLLIISLFLIWFARVLAGDVLPKNAGADDGVRITSAAMTRLVCLWTAMQPVLAIVSRFAESPDVLHRSPEEREEIVERALESLAHSAGINEPVIEEDEREMIQGVMGLETTEVREVMVPRVRIIALEAGSSLEDVRRITVEHGHSRLPIFEDDLDSIIGILYIKDLFMTGQTSDSFDLARLARDAFVVPETKKVDALLGEFRKRQTHIAIVADEFGGTAGLVTLEDILEEIVGEIQDEHDHDESPLRRLDDGTVLADGVLPLEEIAEVFGLNLPDDKFETVGGLIYDRVGGVPVPGQTISDFGLMFRIEGLEGQRISRVRVSRLPAPPQSSG